MQTCFKKTLFVITGLVLIGTGFFLTKTHIANASGINGKVFGDWKVSCVKNENKNNLCFLTQQATTTKDDKLQILAVYQVGYFGKDNVLKFIQIVPLGVNLQSGTSIISGEKLLAPSKFTICTAAGCEAIGIITNDDFQTIISNNNNFLAMMGSDNKQINLPISSKGLKEGLEALK